jgi:hypothetical protein
MDEFHSWRETLLHRNHWRSPHQASTSQAAHTSMTISPNIYAYFDKMLLLTVSITSKKTGLSVFSMLNLLCIVLNQVRFWLGCE